MYTKKNYYAFRLLAFVILIKIKAMITTSNNYKPYYNIILNSMRFHFPCETSSIMFLIDVWKLFSEAPFN